MLKKKWMLFLTIILAFVLVACASDTWPEDNNSGGSDNIDKVTDPNKNGQNDNHENTNNPMNAAYEDIKITPEEAFNTFKEKYSQSKVDKLGLDFDDGSYVYEVEGYDDTKEYELKINPVDGSILREEQDDRDNNKGEIKLEDIEKIQGLIDRTLEDEGKDSRIEEWVLKIENGETVFEIELINNKKNDIEYKYNVNTGELIEKN